MDAGSIKVLEEKKSWKKLDFCSLTWKAFRSCKGASKTRARIIVLSIQLKKCHDLQALNLNHLATFQASSSATTFVDSSKFAAKTEKRSELKHDRKIPAETRKKEKGEKEVFWQIYWFLKGESSQPNIESLTLEA